MGYTYKEKLRFQSSHNTLEHILSGSAVLKKETTELQKETGANSFTTLEWEKFFYVLKSKRRRRRKSKRKEENDECIWVHKKYFCSVKNIINKQV